MSTRSLIGIQQSDGTVKFIYCHFDGYLEGVGRELFEYYTEPEKVAQLIALGDLSSIGSEIGEKHDFDVYPRPANTKDWCMAYHRDRGEKLKIGELPNAEAFWIEDHDAEYWYLFTSGGWLVSAYSKAPLPLKDALAAPNIDDC